MRLLAGFTTLPKFPNWIKEARKNKRGGNERKKEKTTKRNGAKKKMGGKRSPLNFQNVAAPVRHNSVARMKQNVNSK